MLTIQVGADVRRLKSRRRAVSAVIMRQSVPYVGTS